MAKHKRTYNTSMIKKTVSYSMFDIAELFGIHKATVRNWLKIGLRRIDDRRPFLVNGADLKEFLKNRQRRKKQRCQPEEFYCFRCRSPKRSKENMVILKVLNQKIGRLSGLCIECGSKTNKMISLKEISKFRIIFTIVKTHQTDLVVSGSSNVNAHLKEDVST